MQTVDGSLVRGLVKSGFLVSSGQVIGYTLSFVRNIIFARFLAKTDYGLVAALWVTVSLFELVNRMGIRNQVVQAKEGDDPRFQATGQSMQALGGALSGAIILVCSCPMAKVFGAPEFAWAFALIALVPLFRGMMHLDIARFQRQLNFTPGVLVDVIPQAISLAAALPLLAWLGGLRAILIIILGKEFITLAMSHKVSSWDYKLGWDRSYVKRIISFSWPLVLTGIVMFASQQGDQMVVGSALSLSDLASYSLAVEISSIPFFIFGTVLSSLLLPVLSRRQDNNEEFLDLYRKALIASVVGSLVILSPIMIGGGVIIKLVYGAKYSGLGTLMAILGGVVALRFFRLAPSTASMSKADTVNQLVSNIARSMSLPLALAAVTLGSKEITLIAACGLVGELLAISVAVWRVHTRQGIPINMHLKPFAFLIFWIGGSWVLQWLIEGKSELLVVIGLFALLGLAGALAVSLFREVRCALKYVIVHNGDKAMDWLKPW